MLDEKDLQAIAQMMDEKFAQQKQEIATETKQAISESEQRIAKNTVVLMDAEFRPQFKLLSEELELIQEKLVPRSRVDDLEDEVKFLKSVIRQISEDVQQLKQAN